MGLTQEYVSSRIGMKLWAYQKLEQRGQIPEEHILPLAKVLQVTEKELWVQKLAPMMFTIFGIAHAEFTRFIEQSPQVDPRLGNRN